MYKKLLALVLLSFSLAYSMDPAEAAKRPKKGRRKKKTEFVKKEFDPELEESIVRGISQKLQYLMTNCKRKNGNRWWCDGGEWKCCRDRYHAAASRDLLNLLKKAPQYVSPEQLEKIEYVEEKKRTFLCCVLTTERPPEQIDFAELITYYKQPAVLIGLLNFYTQSGFTFDATPVRESLEERLKGRAATSVELNMIEILKAYQRIQAKSS